jgi:SPP1 family predicted phage head-tail adaptor
MSQFTLRRGDLDRRITFQRKPAPGEDVPNDPMDAGETPWAVVAKVWAQVQEMLPSRGERLSEGMNLALRPARIRIDYRADITADMRIIYGTRILQIIAPPIELGRRAALEMMVQDYSTAGGA